MGLSSTGGPQSQARPRARTIAHRSELEWLARAGLVARGIVYGVIGILALKLALGSGGETASQRGALQAIAREPFGQILLIVVCLGLAGYAVWRLVTAAVGPRGEDEHSTLHRGSAAASGLAYAALCLTGVKILVGASTTGGSNSPKHDAAGVLGWTGGPVIVAVAGVGLIGVALYQGYKGGSRKFLEDSRTDQMSPAVKRAFVGLGVFGHLARMIVFAIIGYGVLKAAINYSPHSAVGLDGALAKLGHSPNGPLLLGIVAAGLVGFALYSIADARYRRV